MKFDIKRFSQCTFDLLKQGAIFGRQSHVGYKLNKYDELITGTHEAEALIELREFEFPCFELYVNE